MAQKSSIRHVGPEQIPQPVAGKTIVKEVTLNRGETAWMPGTTKHYWRGPCKLVYKIHPDGGVESEKK